MPGMFRKRPVMIAAVRWSPMCDNIAEVLNFTVDDMGVPAASLSGAQVVIQTLEGTMAANPGDWIIKGVAGEFYPCKSGIFKATYEPMDLPALRQMEENDV